MTAQLFCLGCNAPCRLSDRFCSQCGRPGPAVRVEGNRAESGAIDSGSWLASHTPTVGGGPASDDMFEAGSVFARRYRIERMLGEGGMGRVYLAIDTTIDEPIALKFVSGAHRSNPTLLKQFKQELKLARKIRHRNVVASFHLGEADGRAYIVQEYIDADSLSVRLARKGSMGEAECLGLIRQVLRGLKAAHDLGIVHRDIKAGNILVNNDGIAFITDFGLAYSTAQQTGLWIAGTPQYMAPELFDGAAASPSTDLYACGVLLFHMLVGGLPFSGKSYNDFSHAHHYVAARPIPDAQSVSAPTRNLYAQMLAKDPLERPQRVVDVLEVLESVLALEPLRAKTNRPIALVADVNEAVRAAASERLEREGYQVEAVTTAQDTVDLAFSLAPALVVLDSNVAGGHDIAITRSATSLVSKVLPEHGGLGLCHLLQHDSRLKDVPILVMTEREDPGLRSAFMVMGATEVIAKPFTQEEFVVGLDRARQRAIMRAEEA